MDWTRQREKTFRLRHVLDMLYGIVGPKSLLLVLLELVQALVPVLTLWIAARLVDVLAARSASMLRDARFTLLEQALVVVLGHVAGDLNMWHRSMMTLKVGFVLQQRVFAKLESVPHSWMEDPAFQDWLRRARSGVSQIGNDVYQTLFTGIRGVLTLAGYLVYLARVHWAFPPMLLVAGLASSMILGRAGARRNEQWISHTRLERHVDYLWSLPFLPHVNREVHVFRLWRFLSTKWEQLWTQIQRDRLTLQLKSELATVSASGLTTAVLVGLYMFLLWRVSTGALSLGQFVALGGSILAAVNQLQALAQQFAEATEKWGRLGDLMHLLRLEVTDSAPAFGTEAVLTTSSSGLVCKGLTLIYPGSDQPALMDITLAIRPGERLLIVGDNGSGKSTLIKCLAGLYTPTSGRVEYGDCPITPQNRASYYQRLGVVFQDFGRYDMTAYENLALGAIEKMGDRTALERAAATARVSSFIQQLPEGYETVLGAWLGRPLSVGQWQRIALARVLLRDAEVLLLDEPASALDPQSRVEILNYLLAPHPTRIAVIVSHDLLCHHWTDRILVLKHGRVLELGTHDELLAMNGEYSRLYRAQMHQEVSSLKEEAQDARDCLPINGA